MNPVSPPSSELENPPVAPEEPNPPPSDGSTSHSRSRIVARNVTATMATQIVSWALTFLVTIYVPRYLGASGYGLLNLAGTFGALFGMLVDLGTGTVLTKEIARDRSTVGELVSNAIALRFPLGVLATAVGVGAAFLLHYPTEVIELIAIGLGVMALTQFSGVVTSALYGLEQLHKQNVAAITDKVLLSLLMIALVIRRAPVWEFVTIGAVTGTVSLSINLFFFRYYLRTLQWPRLAAMRSLIVRGLPYVSTGIFNAVYIRTDVVLMSKMASLAAIGWYSVGYRLAGTCMTIPANLCSAMLPTVTRIYHHDPDSFGSAVRRTFNLALIAVVPFSAILLIAPDKLLSLLHYPAEFRHAIPVLMIWGIALILYYLSQVASMALNASDRQWTFSRVTGMAAAFSIPLTALCIYVGNRYFANGAAGAMVSDALAEVFITTAYIRALPQGIFDLSSLGVLGKALIAALPTIAVLHFFVHNRYDLIWLVPAAAIYLPLCWALRCLHPRDVEMIKQMLRRR